MSEIGPSNDINHCALDIKDDVDDVKEDKPCTCDFIWPLLLKCLAEIFGTYFIILAGCGSVAVNFKSDKTVTFPGISITWGLVVMVMVYSIGHISGAHFNPAVTIAHAVTKKFPFTQVPFYIGAHVAGSLAASVTLKGLFNLKPDQYIGTTPTGSYMKAFWIEFLITFYLMFVVCGVATDSRAIGELAGLAVGATVLLNVLFAGPITGASMNPARSLGPAIVFSHYQGLWIYMVAPIFGAIFGAVVYNIIRLTNKPLREITRSGSFLRDVERK
ncbi:Major intrinsic protein [Parasponia andersonii]|uniref:Major intrinsic protein n=1 Tax=Parasponia andersonii TaxID=3476 RepID=A0A2P5CCU8_PARAD|nr:Major intrinsic protein [Parasponia andersonii]